MAIGLIIAAVVVQHPAHSIALYLGLEAATLGTPSQTCCDAVSTPLVIWSILADEECKIKNQEGTGKSPSSTSDSTSDSLEILQILLCFQQLVHS